jgi:hypothetical protein
MTGVVERVTLDNGFYAVYQFKLPATKTWDDYKGITVDYRIDDPALWTAANGARGIRLMGSYKPTDFTFVTGTGEAAGKNLAIASYNAGKNAQYIMDAGLSGDWKTIEAAVVANGLDTEAGAWFTIDYSFSARPNGSFDTVNALPAANASGPFYFGVGISGQGPVGGTVQLIRNVTLVGYEGGDSVVGIPAIFLADGVEYAAYTGYPDVSGGNGYKEANRVYVGTVTVSTIPYTFETYNITFNHNYPSGVSVTQPANFTKTTDRNGNLSADDDITRLARLESYNFKGWWTVNTATGGTQVTANTRFLTDTTVYARWVEGLPLPSAKIEITNPEIDVHGNNITVTQDDKTWAFMANNGTGTDLVFPSLGTGTGTTLVTYKFSTETITALQTYGYENIVISYESALHADATVFGKTIADYDDEAAFIAAIAAADRSITVKKGYDSWTDPSPAKYDDASKTAATGTWNWDSVVLEQLLAPGGTVDPGFALQYNQYGTKVNGWLLRITKIEFTASEYAE